MLALVEVRGELYVESVAVGRAKMPSTNRLDQLQLSTTGKAAAFCDFIHWCECRLGNLNIFVECLILSWYVYLTADLL